MAITMDDLIRAGIGRNGMNPNVIPVADMSISGLPQNAPMQAAPMPAQAAPQQRQGLLGGFFGPQGRDARSRMAIAIEGLMMNPNQALIGQLQEGIQGRETTAQKNATIEWLRSRGRDDLADAMLAGLPAAEALQLAIKPADPMAAINLETAQLELQKLRSGGVDPAKAFTQELDLVKAYRSEPDVQAYTETAGHFGTMSSAYNTMQTDPAAGVQGVGDLAIIYSFMKMLDPGSTVMQGEYASAANTSGVPDQLRNTYNTVIDGAKLNPGQRQAFLTQAAGMLKTRADRLSRVNEVYTGTATRGNVDQGFVIQPPALPSFIPAVVPQSATALGVTQEEWDLMTQDDRKAFMGTP